MKMTKEQRRIKELENALWKALGGLNYLGEILNGHDMVTEQDVAVATPCFNAARKALGLPLGTSEKETRYLRTNGFWSIDREDEP